MANPFLARAGFADAVATPDEGRMTLTGAITRTGVLMGLCAASAAAVWMTSSSLGPSTSAAVMGAAILGFVLAIATSFVPKWAPVTAPMYAIVEGVFLGGLTLMRTPSRGTAAWR